ncbi:MAG: hypothetical protein M1832_001626 [Thelocarpon impressellum]|nr:MAG: hypothetical protein M1832_001626 [Thelocarpon impressellum]
MLKLSDLGEAFHVSCRNREPNVPVGLRAPELIVDCPYDKKIDIWCFGCIAFEFILGSQLFHPDSLGPLEEVDEEHLLSITDTLGDLPDAILAKWPRAKTYFGPNKERLKWDVDDPEDGEEDGPIAVPLEELVRDSAEKKSLSDVDVALTLSLLRDALQLEQSKRPSAARLLQHPFFGMA